MTVHPAAEKCLLLTVTFLHMFVQKAVCLQYFTNHILPKMINSLKGGNCCTREGSLAGGQFTGCFSGGMLSCRVPASQGDRDVVTRQTDTHALIPLRQM